MADATLAAHAEQHSDYIDCRGDGQHKENGEQGARGSPEHADQVGRDAEQGQRKDEQRDVRPLEDLRMPLERLLLFLVGLLSQRGHVDRVEDGGGEPRRPGLPG